MTMAIKMQFTCRTSGILFLIIVGNLLFRSASYSIMGIQGRSSVVTSRLFAAKTTQQAIMKQAPFCTKTQTILNLPIQIASLNIYLLKIYETHTNYTRRLMEREDLNQSGFRSYVISGQSPSPLPLLTWSGLRPLVLLPQQLITFNPSSPTPME